MIAESPDFMRAESKMLCKPAQLQAEASQYLSGHPSNLRRHQSFSMLLQTSHCQQSAALLYPDPNAALVLQYF